ncbi:MAG: type II toxin-antitoxin system VapC family toxin [Brevundimonas sp.]
MRYLLDTNFVSELIRTNVNEAVSRWSEGQWPRDQAISVVTLGEIRYGLELMSPGRRREALETAVRFTLPARFGDRLLSVGPEVADIYGRLLGEGRRIGVEVGDRDLLIAATALFHDLTVVTRNVSHFAPFGVSFLNPWTFEV